MLYTSSVNRAGNELAVNHCATQITIRECLLGPTLRERHCHNRTSPKQRKAARFCLQNYDPKASVTDIELELDTLQLRRKKNKLALIYKLSHNLMGTEAEKYLVPDSETRTRKSHAFKYRIPRISKNVFQFSFFQRSICESSGILCLPRL